MVRKVSVAALSMGSVIVCFFFIQEVNCWSYKEQLLTRNVGSIQSAINSMPDVGTALSMKTAFDPALDKAPSFPLPRIV
jgi:hypothetical protein